MDNDTKLRDVVVPEEYVDLAVRWHDGQSSMLYVIASCGDLALGCIRPSGCDTDEKWHLHLWHELSVEVMHARLIAGDENVDFSPFSAKDDYEALYNFENWIDNDVIPELELAYGLENWES